MEPESPMELVRSWLVEGSDEPESFVDIKWRVIEEESRDGRPVRIRVTHEKLPVNLLVVDLEPFSGAKAIRLVIETGIDTADLDRDRKLRLYRMLLDASKLPFVAFYLFGPHDEVAIAVDMDKRALTREELEDNMRSLMLAFFWLAEQEEVREKLLAESYMVLLRLVSAWFREGLPREDAMERLLSAGVDRELADKIVSRIYGGEGGEERRESGGTIFI